MVAAVAILNSPAFHYDPLARQQEHFMPPIAPAGRDLRLDLFRGLALWLIFVDHIPSNIVNWITIRNYGFSDAAEIFVFISGYTAAFVYGRTMRSAGYRCERTHPQARVDSLHRPYLHVRDLHGRDRLCGASFENPLYTEEMGILDFMKEPGDTLIQALLLKFKPTIMDVLPLYIVLLHRLSAGVVAVAARTDGGARALGRALYAELESELELTRPIRPARGSSIRSPGSSSSCSARGAGSAG